MQTARFTLVKEDFDCAFCGTHNKGRGCTNHCTECGSSLHVDGDNPGDRASDCHGLMLAVSLEHKNGRDYIVHKCVKCGQIRRNRVSPNDSFEMILALSNGTIDAYRENLLLQKKLQASVLKNKTR